MNLIKSSCGMKDKDWKAVESIFKHDQEVVMPGFRFHPTEEELVEFYLRRKVEGQHFDIELITSVDLYRYDPWELPALASIGEKEWFFYVQRDRKYRKGDRPNRVTTSGYWKATGADRMIGNGVSRCIGLKKTLVFYKGKAPKGKRTSWIMNEYRLPQLENQRIQKNDLSLCRVYKKPGGSEVGRPQAKERHNRTENHKMQEWATMHQCQTYIACSNPRTTAESCNFEIKTGSTDEIIKLEELPTDINTVPKSISGEERYLGHMEYGVPDQSENIRERIYNEGGNVWSTVGRPISLNEDVELSLTTGLMCPRAPDQLAMAEDPYNNNPPDVVLICSDKLWEWNPVRNNGNGPSC